MQYRTWTDQEFISAYKTAKSVAHLIRTLGLVPAGGNYKTVKDTCVRLNLPLISHQGVHPVPRTPRKKIEEYLIYGRTSSDNLKKRLIKEGIKKHQCEECLLTLWLGRPIPLELDHIDGDSYNSIIENLRFLCPNCHSLTPTYRGKNIGKIVRNKTLPV